VIGILKGVQNGGQPIRSDGPETHLATKAGTPTMGGIMIIISLFSGVLLWADLSNLKVLMCMFVTIGFSLIGAADDFYKLKFRNHKGLSVKKRLIAQSMVAVVAYLVVYSYSDPSISTKVFLPIFKNLDFDLGLFFFLWVLLVVVGSSNAVNLTDGLDGLAVGPSFVSSVCFAIISYLVGHFTFSSYLHIPYVPDIAEVCVFLSSLVGASLGFLWFNSPPAKIFMGDTGSLSIGGILGFVSVLTKHEVIFSIIGGIFVLETVSVILQVLSFKLMGKRIFLMAPIHHHFEKKGWSEATVVFRFWIISFVLGILGLAAIKLR
jgi:phospho-N-acetylmuramoyl-pentapeptide-transferase